MCRSLDVAPCYGWIDSRRDLDAGHYLQRYSPRRPKSLWSQINLGEAEVLIATGRMRKPGYAAIASAEADGRGPEHRELTEVSGGRFTCCGEGCPVAAVGPWP